MKPNMSEKNRYAKESQNEKGLTKHPEWLVQGRSLEEAAEEWLTLESPKKDICSLQGTTSSEENHRSYKFTIPINYPEVSLMYVHMC